MPRLSSWYAYYKNRKPNISNILLHWQYLARIIWFKPKSLLEIGCGPAEHSLFVKKLIPSVKLSLLDQDRKLLNFVVTRNRRLINKYYVADISSPAALSKLQLSKYDLVISQGLMEHFSDQMFARVITNIGELTKHYLFSIPSNLYPNQDYGNEILRSCSQVEQLLSRVPNIAYKVIPYFDIGFRTKIIAKKLKKMTLLPFIKYFLFGSLHLLIEIKYL
ncbi:MAG: hypothetical protein US96_C0002G0012 [Candidatus Woesebacteria bacterium GW2011_GWB1_38_5b]|uniref:Methyltransferase domain-containing protein n=1 Tax=Candidatus Woesebacteria bacterium GW2011_GWB1_38_5b TaxID=1618569 RepID=A0A0G0MQF2_9BACT|nr:MAG: hypothetical protein US96_C0002G0012 [Candidatus Woesebacteria bacterium GW2011_GWB1_38_5b]